MTQSIAFRDLPPEIHYMIEPFLTQHQFTICVRVCQAWRAIFTPFLWRHVERKSWYRSDDSWEDVFSQCCASGALNTNGHWIQSINLVTYEEGYLNGFLEHAPPTFLRLTSAEFTDVESDMAIADLIDRGKGGWKKIVIYGCYECVCFDSLSAEALLKHASTLEILTMESAPGFSSKYIQQLLCTAPKLKEFYLLGPERLRDNVDGTLDVRDVVESEWVCTELEVFGCQIGNIPRPDITRTIDGHPASNYVVKGTLEESIDLQRRVCSQLGRLTRLTELTLGTSFKSYWGGVPEYHRLYDCLSLALESGLDLLCNLKELQIFELNDMEVYIRRDEEWNWVKKNWPKAAKSGIRAD